MDATALLFSDPAGNRMGQLTMPSLDTTGSMAALPFGCRYRLIDFSLSAIVNAGIRKVTILSARHDSALMEHIGSGKDWDLALRSGGIRFLLAERLREVFPSELELLREIRQEIAADSETFVVIGDGDAICNPNLEEMLRLHREQGADLTVAVKQTYLSSGSGKYRERILCKTDENQRLTDVYTASNVEGGYYPLCMHLYIIRRTLLLQLLDEANAHNLVDFYADLLKRCIGRFSVMAYRYEGFYAKIQSLAEYFSCSMQLASDSMVRKDLFENAARPILTRVRNSPPTHYCSHARVRSSLIADGCVIDGEVENSILFRGVKVERGAVVRNSILLRGCVVESCTALKCVVSGSESRIRGTLCGIEALPFLIGEGTRL